MTLVFGTGAVHSNIRKRVLKNLLKQMPGAYEITDKSRAIVYSSSLDFMTLVEGNSVLLRHIEMMKRHSDEVRREKLSRSRK